MSVPLMILLLNRGVSFSKLNHQGEMPLHIACRNKQAQAAKLLVERGASVSQLDKTGRSALSYYKAMPHSKAKIELKKALNL